SAADSLYSITSSARARSVGGTSRPSALAVFASARSQLDALRSSRRLAAASRCGATELRRRCCDSREIMNRIARRGSSRHASLRRRRNDRVNIPAQEQGNVSKMHGGEGGHGYPNRNSWAVSPSQAVLQKPLLSSADRDRARRAARSFLSRAGRADEAPGGRLH